MQSHRTSRFTKRALCWRHFTENIPLCAATSFFPCVQRDIQSWLRHWAMSRTRQMDRGSPPAICTSIIVPAATALTAATQAHFYLCAPEALMKSHTICSCRLPRVSSGSSTFGLRRFPLISGVSALGANKGPVNNWGRLVAAGIFNYKVGHRGNSLRSLSRWPRALIRAAAKTHFLRCTHAADQSAARGGSF